jgi:small-conductance mechanosensitive channel
MSSLRLRVLVVVFSAAGLYLTVYALSEMGLVLRDYAQIVNSAVLVFAGIFIIRLAGSYIVRTFKPLVGQQAAGVSLIFQLLGYIVIAVIVLSSFGLSPQTALAGGTLTGLVIGFAAQTTLSNVIAGIIILFSRPFKIGDRVAIITSAIPYQWASLPGYKFFSRDYVIPAYTGVVENMSLMYTTLVTDDGLVIKIPNNLVLSNSAVANYSEVTERLRKLRYEFPVTLNPSEVIAAIREKLRDNQYIRDVYIEEQSDKTYYIVAVLFEPPYGVWQQVKSQILENVIEVHRSLVAQQQQFNSNQPTGNQVRP